MGSAEKHLQIQDLYTYFYSQEKRAFIRAVNGVSLDVYRGETLGIVGESGSGKSITMLSIMGLISASPGVLKGDVRLQTRGGEIEVLRGLDRYVTLQEENGHILEVNKNLDGWQRNQERNMAQIRGKEVSMIFQNPKQAFNPFSTVGTQIAEMVRLHTPATSKAESKEKAIEWLQKVKIDAPADRYFNYPYGLSGGMCQRAMVAMALSSEPSFLIADEPTTGLDATIQSRVIELLEEMQKETGISMVLISHDISVISRLSDRIAVMYGGMVMEVGPSQRLLAKKNDNRHPYTEALLSSIPSKDNIIKGGYLKSIEGEVPNNVDVSRGCRFASRCQKKIGKKCENEQPPLISLEEGHQVRCWLFSDQGRG